MRRSMIQRWRQTPWKLRWAIWVVAAVVVFYSIENFRGAYALKRYQSWVEAREWVDETPRDLPLPKINLFDFPDAAPGFTGDGLFHWEKGGFNPFSVRSRSYGFAACEPFPFSEVFEGDEGLSPVAGAEKYLLLSESNKSALDAFREAVANSNVIHFSSDDADASLAKGASLNAIQSTNIALRYRSSANIQIGNKKEALADILASIRSGDLLCNRDQLIDQLTGQVCWTLIADSIWEGLELRMWSDADYEMLSRLALSQAYDDMSIDVFYGEMEFALNQLDKSNSFFKRVSQVVHGAGPVGEAAALEALLSGFGKGPGFLDRMASRLGEAMYCLIPTGWYALWLIDEKESFRAECFPKTVSDPLPFYFQIRGRAHHSYAYLIERRNRNIATRRLVGIAAANERFFLRNGKYVDQLKELVPQFLDKVPLDPFTGREFLYLSAGTRSERPVIYSVGANGLDDGGYPQRKKEQGDIVWQYEFPSNFTMDHFLDNQLP